MTLFRLGVSTASIIITLTHFAALRPPPRNAIIGHGHLTNLESGLLDFQCRTYSSAIASAADLPVGEELLDDHSDLTVFGDKAFISQTVAQRLLQDHRIHLLTIPRQAEGAITSALTD